MSEQTSPLNKQLQEALSLFSRSTRFPLLKTVQVGRLMPEGGEPLGDLAELTFEQLIERITLASDTTVSITQESEQALLHLLSALSEDSGESSPLAPEEDISVVVPDSFTSIDIPTLDEDLKKLSEVTSDDEPPTDVPIGSVPLELALRANLAKITTHDRYNQVRQRRIGDFWDPKWTPAPFEEAITIEQLAGLDLATLFKKRMVTDTRVQSILRALNRVLEFLGERSSSTEEGTDPRAPVAENQRERSREKPEAIQRRVITEIPAEIGASVEALAIWESINASCVDEAELRIGDPIATKFLACFSPSRCVEILLGGDLDRHERSLLSKIINDGLSAGALELSLALLKSPGAKVDLIAKAVFGSDLPVSSYKRAIATLIARGLLAKPVRIRGRVISGFWTLDQKLLERSAKSPRNTQLTSLDPFLHSLISRGKR